MSIKLKPCPFCGHKEPSIIRYGTPRMSTQYECGMCGCSLETPEEWDHGKYWNSREPQLDAEEFMTYVYNQIKHGDAEHHEWLRAKCTEIAKYLKRKLK